jgi:hypothetical protein
VFNATFSNISAISWRPVLVVEEAGVPGENHRQQQKNNQKDATSNTNKEYCNQLYVIFIFCSVNNLTYPSKYHTQEIRMILQSLKGQQERCALQSIMGFYPAIIIVASIISQAIFCC